MNKTTWIGLLLAVGAMLGAMLLKHINFGILLNYPAILIIFVGTFAALMVSYPMKDIKKLGTLIKLVAKEQNIDDLGSIIIRVVRLSEITRKEGLLVLETEAEKEENKFLKTGLLLIADGLKVEDIRELLEEDMNAREERHASYRGIFTQASAYAPALGVLGAVFGLMAALSSMDDLDALSQGISAAFVATIFGIFTAYIVWAPFASKLKRRTEEETALYTAIMEGLLALADGDAPSYIIHKMMAYVPTDQRDAVLEEIKNAKKAS